MTRLPGPSYLGTAVEALVTVLRQFPDNEDTAEVLKGYIATVGGLPAQYDLDEVVRWWLFDIDDRLHTEVIAALRGRAKNYTPGGNMARSYLAAAALLECHDATGINLTNNWPDVEAFVNGLLRNAGLPYPVKDNGA